MAALPIPQLRGDGIWDSAVPALGLCACHCPRKRGIIHLATMTTLPEHQSVDDCRRSLLLPRLKQLVTLRREGYIHCLWKSLTSTMCIAPAAVAACPICNIHPINVRANQLSSLSHTSWKFFSSYVIFFHTFHRKPYAKIPLVTLPMTRLQWPWKVKTAKSDFTDFRLTP